MNKFFGLIAVAGLAAAASAQVTGSYTFEVSSDNGTTWSNAANVAAGATVKVRVLCGWSGITGTDVGLAGGQFDVTLLGATAASSVSNMVRPAPFAFQAQTLAATVYAGGIKLDTAADVAAPGAGTGWVNPGQSASQFSAPGTYNSSNPCIVFTFDVAAGDNMTLSAICNPATGRAISVYTNAGGTQSRISASATTINTATISIPTPGSLALLGLGGLAAARRRR